jgi:hypothetical protein
VPAVQQAFFSADRRGYTHQYINYVYPRFMHPRQVVGTGQSQALFVVSLRICFDTSYFCQYALG